MDRDDPIEILSGDEAEDAQVSRRAILEPVIRSVVDALGGCEGGCYRLGDECYGCLKDLKKFWRKDDTDDERTVARIFWETRLLPNDLLPILMETAGRGNFEDKRAVACVDLLTAMTWPIDLAEELQELDEVEDKGTDYTQLLSSHLHYKEAMLKPEIIQALFGIVVVCVSKDSKERKPRDVQIMNVVLYLIRNLAFIKDPPANSYLSADQAQLSSMQSRLIRLLSEQKLFEFLLTLASNAGTDPVFNTWNTLVLEIFYLLFRGVKPSLLAQDQVKATEKNLQRLLAIEDGRRRNFNRNASTRHSRFGTTISVTVNPKKTEKGPNEGGAAGQNPDSTGSKAFVLHRQQAINRDTGNLLDMTSGKRSKAQKGKKVDELGREDNLSVDAKSTLQEVAKMFTETCFNAFLASLLKDIKAERPKIAEKDNVRLLFVTKWFLEFFRCIRGLDKSHTWEFGLITEVTDRSWIVWILKRMREAVEDKPKRWTELQAGIECLTQLILLVDSMSSSEEEEISEPARILQHQIIYNGEVLDIALESMRTYKEGTQSLVYLDSSVHMAYALLRMLEKWSKGKGETLVRRKVKKKRARGKNDNDATAVDDGDENEESEEEIHESMFTFDAFEQRFAHPDVTQTLLAYLARYQEFSSPESMKRVVNLLHRQVVRAKAEGLFFKVSTLDLFKTIHSDKSLSKEQPYKDLVALIKFILRKFFKAVEEDPFVVIQAFFPKNRGQWKHFSSWEPEQKLPKALRMEDDIRFPPDVQVKKGYSWSEQLAISMACLIDSGKKDLVDWVKQILGFVVGQRQRIVEDTDGSSSKMDGDDLEELEANENLTVQQGPSAEAIAKFTDYMIPYISDEQASAATRNPHMKLLFRLVQFSILDEDADELEWYVPATTLPSDLQRSMTVINQFLESPLDLGDKKAEQLLQKKRRRRSRRREPSPMDDGTIPSDEQKEKKEKKQKEIKIYKSAQFIEDSDDDAEAMEAFFAKEKALRERTALAALASGKDNATMKPTGTKKRRKRNAEDGGKRKRKKESVKDVEEHALSRDPSPVVEDADSDENPFDPFASPKGPTENIPRVRPRPRPRRIAKATPKTLTPEPHGSSGSPPKPPDQDDSIHKDTEGSPPASNSKPTRRKVVVISDDDE